MRGFYPFRTLPGLFAKACPAVPSTNAEPSEHFSAAAVSAVKSQHRGLHKASHPLHLLRRQSADSAVIGRKHPPFFLNSSSNGGECLPLTKSPAISQPSVTCPCCRDGSDSVMSAGAGMHFSRRLFGQSGTLSNVESRNRRNAAKSLLRRDRKGESTSISISDNAEEMADAVESQTLEKEMVRFVGGRLVQSLQREQPPRGSGIQPLLDYNKQWAAEIARLNNNYFSDLAQQQSPQYLWIGCSDSRVPANEIVGLYPGDVFVHRNIANIICNSDLNALAVLQYAIDCLKVEHVIIAGHYKCGGVTAALNEDRVGLADHWILHVSAVKKRHWRRMQSDLASSAWLDALCELNVLAQVESVVETHLVQRVWSRQNAEDALARKEGRPSRNSVEQEVEIHGWVYGLADGVVRPLLSLTRRSNVERELANATEAVFWRYGQLS